MTSKGDDAGGETAARRRYLDAAANLLHDSPDPLYPYVMSHLNSAAIAQRLGVGRTALYRLWPSQPAFWDDLIVRVMTAQGTAHVPEAGDPTAIFNRMQTSARNDPATVLRTALLAYERPARCELLLAWHVAVTLEATTEQLDVLLFAQGRAPLEPLTTRDLARAVCCVVDGLAHASRLSDRVERRDIALPGGPGGLLAHAVDCLFERCTRPRTSEDLLTPRRSASPAVTPPRLSKRQNEVIDATALMFEQSLTDPSIGTVHDGTLSHLTMSKLARRTRVSRQSVQSFWPNQRAFSLDLMRYLHRRERTLLHDSTRDAPMAIDGSLRLLTAAATATSQPHLAFAPYFANADIRTIGRTETEAGIEQFANDLRASVGAGVEPRRGLTWFDLAAIVVLTEAGAVRLSRIDPTMTHPTRLHRGRRVSALAICLESIAAHTLVPQRQGLDER